MSHRDSPIKTNKELSKPMDFFNVGFVGGALGGGGGIDITSGGTLTTSGAYSIRTFTSSANAVIASSGELEVFIIGGGGSGSNSGGGAGGGGSAGVVNAFDIDAGTYSVVVGAGGSFHGYNGADSTFNGITSQGGGGGNSNGTGLSDCRNCTFPAGITGTVHGNTSEGTTRGGAGGAGGNGLSGVGTIAGYGGAGWQLTGFDGTSYYYGGGGGAGGMNNYYGWKGAGDGGSGGAGGGGAGHSAHGNAGTGGGAGQWSRLGNGGTGGRNNGGAGAYQKGGNGGQNTGSGSGGAGHTSPLGNCLGGSGIVILRYLTP